MKENIQWSRAYLLFNSREHLEVSGSQVFIESELLTIKASHYLSIVLEALIRKAFFILVNLVIWEEESELFVKQQRD